MNDSGTGVAGNGFEAGWARVDMTPAEPVPLAGYTHLSDRMSKGVHDPVFVRAVVMKQEGGPAVALVMYDLVIVSEDLYQGLRARLSDTGLTVMCAATHTHSSFGGFWNAMLGRAFLGRFRPGVLESLIEMGEKAVRDALAGIGPAIVKTGTKKIPGLNGNRRDHHGPLDEELHVVTLEKQDSRALLFSYPGHPVISAERDHNVVSADFPGLAISKIEGQFDFAMYMPGALGGVDVRFPREPVPIDDNLEMMAAPIAHTAMQVARDGNAFADERLVLAHSIRELHFDRPRIRWSYDDDRKPFDFLLDALANGLARPVPRVARIEGFRIADVAVVGFPCDLGIGLSLRVKQIGRELGLKGVVTMSESGGCVGYVHLPEDYSTTPADEGDAIQMGRYENAMNFFGHQTGTRFLEAADGVLKELA
ncbi:MAG TPA: neutral/alkaline non-lysosomal ceramidase N-terminal domain-containing protein [Myxococcota bacterium]|nr:neutral/alkaline non-lysosomal ceramidase N-terminal domain-containing protein [Myxococcota bacterium]